MGIGDWGLGIGPNPKSPIPIKKDYIFNISFLNNQFNFFLLYIIIKTMSSSNEKNQDFVNNKLEEKKCNYKNTDKNEKVVRKIF